MAAFHPKARRELRDAVHFYKEEGGSEIARSFLAEYERIIALLMQNPALGTPVDDDRRTYPFKRFPYSIIYRTNSSGIYVLAVWHQKRHPGGWQGRR